MAVLTDPLLWCVIQVTLVGVLAWALCAVVRRWSAPGSAAVPAAALAAVVVLTFCAFAPWPGWWRFDPQWDQTVTAVVSSQDQSPREPSNSEPTLDASEIRGATALNLPQRPQPYFPHRN